jgi:hypothetical protein
MSEIWYKHIHWYACKVRIFLCDFNATWIFETAFRKFINIKFHENLSSGTELSCSMQTDRRTDMTMPVVTFCNFQNAPINTVLASKKTHCVSYTKNLVTVVDRNCTKPYKYPQNWEGQILNVKVVGKCW